MSRCSVVVLCLALLVLVTLLQVSGAQKSKFTMISVITIADADASNELSVVTDEDCFARISVSRKTDISHNGAKIAFANIKKGFTITCKGNWDSNDFNVFRAAYVFIGKEADNSVVMENVSAACRKVSESGVTYRKSVPSSAGGSPDRDGEKAKPQLEITVTGSDRICINDDPNEFSRGFISVEVKNLTDRRIPGLQVQS